MLRAAYYQRTFKLICPIRGERALVTIPKFELVKLPVGLLNWPWLKKLKNSARNCNEMFSRIRVVL